MVDKILFTPWYEAELKQPMATTQKTGWSPLPAGYQRLVAEFPADSSVAVDKTQWDWTMPEWVIRAYVDMKRYQLTEEVPPEYWTLVWARLYYVLGPGARFRMPNGVQWRQLGWGLMKSGWLLTLSLNSAAQGFQHALAWFRMGKTEPPPSVWAMGDDILAKMKLTEEELQLYWEKLETTGCKVKKIERRREFCGFDFVSDEVVNPLYPDKHQFILQHLDPAVEQETLLSYSLLYALSDLGWVKKIYPYQERALGPLAKLWAKGLVKLDVLPRVPDWASF